MEVFAKRLEYLPFDNSTEEIKPREIDSATFNWISLDLDLQKY